MVSYVFSSSAHRLETTLSVKRDRKQFSISISIPIFSLPTHHLSLNLTTNRKIDEPLHYYYQISNIKYQISNILLLLSSQSLPLLMRPVTDFNVFGF